MLACRVFGAPPAPILAESVHPCSAETTSVIDKPVLRDMKRNRNTFNSFLDTDGFPSHVSHLYILQPASVPEIPEEFLRDFQMKIFPSAMSAVPQFLGFINPTPTKSHKHALFHEQSGSFHLFSGLPTAYKGQEKKSQQLNHIHQIIMAIDLKAGRKEGRPCHRLLWYEGVGIWWVCVCVHMSHRQM